MAVSVFISYRRDGGDIMAQLLYEHLKMHDLNVFYDIHSLGTCEFNVKISNAIRSADCMVVLLSKGCLDRCCDNPNDWVRQEIALAFSLGKDVIPVFMKDFRFPDNLPEDIKRIVHCNGIIIDNMTLFDARVEHLAKMCRESAIKHVDNNDYTYKTDDAALELLEERKFLLDKTRSWPVIATLSFLHFFSLFLLMYSIGSGDAVTLVISIAGSIGLIIPLFLKTKKYMVKSGFLAFLLSSLLSAVCFVVSLFIMFFTTSKRHAEQKEYKRICMEIKAKKKEIKTKNKKK